MLTQSIPNELSQAILTGLPVATNPAQSAELIAAENRQAVAFAKRRGILPDRATIDYRERVRTWARHQLFLATTGDAYAIETVNIGTWLNAMADALIHGDLPRFIDWRKDLPDFSCPDCKVDCGVSCETEIVNGDEDGDDYFEAECPICSGKWHGTDASDGAEWERA